MIPRLALSIRQPWAWAVIHGGKDIENRSWRQPNPGLGFRGDFAVHAAQGMTKAEYEDGADMMDGLGIACPAPAELHRGGIIGVATVTDIVKASPSPWFFGPRGLVIKNPRPVDFIRVEGMLGFFEWHRSEEPLLSPLRWMERYGAADPNGTLPLRGLF